MASRAAMHIQERRTANCAMDDSEHDAGLATPPRPTSRLPATRTIS
jgi:hypothetical protein